MIAASSVLHAPDAERLKAQLAKREPGTDHGPVGKPPKAWQLYRSPLTERGIARPRVAVRGAGKIGLVCVPGRADPTDGAGGWARPGISSLEPERGVVPQVRGVVNLPQRRHVVAVGAGRQGF